MNDLKKYLEGDGKNAPKELSGDEFKALLQIYDDLKSVGQSYVIQYGCKLVLDRFGIQSEYVNVGCNYYWLATV